MSVLCAAMSGVFIVWVYVLPHGRMRNGVILESVVIPIGVALASFCLAHFLYGNLNGKYPANLSALLDGLDAKGQRQHWLMSIPPAHPAPLPPCLFSSPLWNDLGRRGQVALR